MDENDFIQAFSGIDLLQIDAIGKAIGRAEGALFRGMMEVGLPERDAYTIIDGAHRAFFHCLFRMPKQLPDN